MSHRRLMPVMGAEGVEQRADRRVACLAASQHGVVGRAQLVGAGLSRSAIEHRIAAGWLHRLHRGVYAVGHRNVGADGHRLAAVLTCGPRAVLSHRSAAAHWGLRPSAGARIEVAVPSLGGRRPRDGLIVHRLGSLRGDQTTIHERVPITTPARTLFDIAGLLPRRPLERAVEEAERLRLFDLTQLESVLNANRGRVGSAALVAVLAEHRVGTTLTRSELEERFLAICDELRLDRPLVNARLLGFEVDFLWRRQRLVVETDGHASHGTRAAFERDRARDARLTAAGYRVVRFTHRRLRDEPTAVTHALTSLLETPSV